MFPFFSTKKMGKKAQKATRHFFVGFGVSSFRKNVVKKGICQHTISFFLRKRWSNRSCFSHLLLCETTNPPFETKVCFSCCQQNSQIFVSFLSLKFGVSKSVFLVLFFCLWSVWLCAHFQKPCFCFVCVTKKNTPFFLVVFQLIQHQFCFCWVCLLLVSFLNKSQNHEKGSKKKHQNQSFFNTQRKKEEIAFLLHLPLHEKVFSLVLTQKYPHIWTVLFAMKNKIGVFCWYFRQSVGLGHLVLGE